MEPSIFQQPWFLWGLGLGLGFPLVMLTLGEVCHHLERRGKPLAKTLRTVQQLLIPALVVLLFVSRVLGYEAEGSTFRIIATVFWILVIHSALSLLNVMVFAQAGDSSWRARVPALLRDLSRLFLILLGTAVVLSVVWSTDLAGLLTALGVGSIVIGLALQDTLGNVFSGIAMLFEAPFRVGDRLRIGDQTGRVIEINWRAVRLESRQKEMLVVPNSILGQELIYNLSRPQPLRAVSMVFSFSYDDPPNRVKRVLRQVALATAGVLAEPEPEIHTQGYSDSAIDYEVEVFVDDRTDDEDIRDSLATRVWYAAKRNGLTIPFPTRTVHSVEAGAVLQDAASAVAERLRSVPSLVPIESRTFEDLVGGARLQHFGKGESVIREGELDKALYVILDGQVVMTVTGPQDSEVEIARLKRGELFGESALLKSSPSSVTVTAAEDLELVAIYPDAVRAMLESTPVLARELSETLEARRKATVRMRDTEEK